jgi:nitrous oxide reductase accessory protein NosL
MNIDAAGRAKTSATCKAPSGAPRKGFALMLLLALLLAVSPAGAADKAPLKPGPQDKCPVCGMPVAGFPNWVSTVTFKDGSHAFFDGPKDMFKYLLDLKRYNPSKQPGDIEAVWVTDYYKVAPIDGRKAWYVSGSDVNGPMGEELVPFGKESDAKAFSKDHKGKKILTFDAVRLETLSVPEGHGVH